MARTHGSRLDQLEQTCMRFILKSEVLERENAELQRTIEKLKARLERLEAAAQYATRKGAAVDMVLL